MLELPLTTREVQILYILEHRLPGTFPKQFSLEWLVSFYYSLFKHEKAAPTAHESLRGSLIMLGLKLMSVRVGSIRAMSKRGRGGSGIYQLNQEQGWSLHDQAGKVMLRPFDFEQQMQALGA